MTNMINFFTFSNLLNVRPSISNQFLLWELIFFGLLLVLAFSAKLYFRPKISYWKSYQNLIDKIFSCLVTCATLDFVLIFFQWQQIPYLSAIILVVILFVTFVIWLIIIGKYYFVDFQSQIKAEKEKKNYEKYLPRRITK